MFYLYFKFAGSNYRYLFMYHIFWAAGHIKEL